jgi:hypothetical protein
MNKKEIFLPLFFVLFWQVSFAQQTILNDSNLPIMVISTDIDPATNAPIDIPDEPKVLATMQLIFRPDGTRNYLTDITNDSFLNYTEEVALEHWIKNHMDLLLFLKMMIPITMLV